MPKEDFKKEVEKELTGQEREPWELIYFKLYPSRLYYATVMKRACRRAARILTVSEFTRTQIIDRSGVSPEKVSNVGCGVDAAYHPNGDSYGLPFPYFFSVTNRRRHKNEFRMVEAFAKPSLAPG